MHTPSISSLWNSLFAVKTQCNYICTVMFLVTFLHFHCCLVCHNLPKHSELYYRQLNVKDLYTIQGIGSGIKTKN